MSSDKKRFAVSVIAPPGYVHSAAFFEVAEGLHLGLQELGHDSVLSTEMPPDRTIVVLGSNLIPGTGRLPPRGSILFNLEQVSPGSPWMTPGLLELFRRYRVWDYSRANVEQLVRLGIPAPALVRIGYVGQHTRIPKGPEDIDVLFYGSDNPRRFAILRALTQRGLRVVRVPFGTYGPARDAYVARSKVVLNVHFYEAKVFEIVRVSYLLANGRAVVSERGADAEEEREFEPGVAFARYDDLVERTVELVRDERARTELAARGLEVMRARPQAELLREAVNGSGAE
jgi:hypothetical protein